MEYNVCFQILNENFREHEFITNFKPLPWEGVRGRDLILPC